mgnify:CR=1 FL=1
MLNESWATLWEALAAKQPDHVAVVIGDTHIRWRDLDDRASRIASLLTEFGVGHDAKVGQLLFNCPEYLETAYASFKVRASTVNVNYRYLDEELLYLLDNSDAEALFFHSSLGDRVARVVDRLPKLKLLVEVSDDGEHHVVSAVPYNTLVTDYDPMPRITRDEDAIEALEADLMAFAQMVKTYETKLRTALANGDCSTSAFATCSMKSWFQSVNLK